jgi:steroid delta-isomerase-like uncharacterized protein
MNMAKTTMSDDRKNLENFARVFEEAFNRGDVNVLDEVLSPNYKEHQHEWPATLEGFKAAIRELRVAYPDLKMKIEDSVSAGNKVWARITCSGTHRGQYKGLAPTGKRFETTDMHVCRFEDGKAVEHWGVLETSRWMEQLGLRVG